MQRQATINSNFISGGPGSIYSGLSTQYQKFKKYALELSPPYNIFEGDVTDMFANPSIAKNIVEDQISKVFAITNTVAKLVGLKEIE